MQKSHDWGYTPPNRSSEREAYEMSKQQSYQQQQPQYNEPDISTTSGFFEQVIPSYDRIVAERERKTDKLRQKKIDRVKSDIDAINYNIDQIGNLHNNALASFNEQQSKQTARDLEKIKTDTQAKNMVIKTRIQGRVNLFCLYCFSLFLL